MIVVESMFEAMRRDPLSALAVFLPLIVVLVMVYRMSTRIRRLQTIQREACLREIESAGGFEAWKRIHFPSAIPE
jgi:hypothetical protein